MEVGREQEGQVVGRGECVENVRDGETAAEGRHAEDLHPEMERDM